MFKKLLLISGRKTNCRYNLRNLNRLFEINDELHHYSRSFITDHQHLITIEYYTDFFPAVNITIKCTFDNNEGITLATYDEILIARLLKIFFPGYKFDKTQTDVNIQQGIYRKMIEFQIK